MCFYMQAWPHTPHMNTHLKCKRAVSIYLTNRHPGPIPSKLSWKREEGSPMELPPSSENFALRREFCFEPGHLVAEVGFELTSSCFNFPKAVLFTSVNAKPKRESGLDVLPEFAPVSSRERSHSFQHCQRSKSRGQQAGAVPSTLTLVQY